MLEFIAQNMAPIMFAALVVFLLSGYPVAFSLGACGLLFFVIGVELAPYSKCTEISSVCHKVGDQIITLDWPLLWTMPARLYDFVLRNDLLLAIPFFTFMGLILERSGMAEDLLDTIGQVFGAARGGLAYAVIFVGALLAATTGVVAASVISMGLISLPIMLRYGYDRRVATGVIAASGTLAQIIPPSLVLIVLADQLQADVGSMYAGAFGPGLVLAGLYAGYVLIVSLVRPSAVPGLPTEAQRIKEDRAHAPTTGMFTGLANLIVLPFLFLFFAFEVAAAVMSFRGQSFALSDLWSGFTPASAAVLACAAVGLGLAAHHLLVRGPSWIGERPRLNLLAITMLSVLAGVAVMGSLGGFSGVDYVVLVMTVSVLVAFALALGNRRKGMAGILAILAGVGAAIVVGSAYAPKLTFIAGNDWKDANLALNGLLRGLVAAVAGLAVMQVSERGLALFAPARAPVLSRMSQEVTFVMVPPLALIFLVLGTIFIGVATPTEGGAMGAVGALTLAAVKRLSEGNAARFNWSIVRQAAESTAKLSAFVIFILVGARIFSLTFYAVGGEKWVEHHLTSLPGGLYGFLIIINAAVFLLAFFLDFFELAFIVIPLLLPAAIKIFTTDPTALEIARSFGLTAEHEIKKGMIVWLGIMLGVNMQTSFMHPPFGFALFYLRSVAPKFPYLDRITKRQMEPVTTGQIYVGAIPFVVIQLIMVAIVMLVPSLTISEKKARPLPSQQTAPATTTAPKAPELGLPPLDFSKPPQIGTPPATTAPSPPALDLSKPPDLGTPPTAPRPPAPQPQAPIDLSQPPKFN